MIRLAGPIFFIFRFDLTLRIMTLFLVVVVVVLRLQITCSEQATLYQQAIIIINNWRFYLYCIQSRRFLIDICSSNTKLFFTWVILLFPVIIFFNFFLTKTLLYCIYIYIYMISRVVIKAKITTGDNNADEAWWWWSIKE